MKQVQRQTSACYNCIISLQALLVKVKSFCESGFKYKKRLFRDLGAAAIFAKQLPDSIEYSLVIVESDNSCNGELINEPLVKTKYDRYAHKQEKQSINPCFYSWKTEGDIAPCIGHSYTVADKVTQKSCKSCSLYAEYGDKSEIEEDIRRSND